MADRIDPCQLLTPAELKGRFGTLPTNQPVAHDGDGTQDAPRDGYGAYHGCEWSVPDLTSTVPGVFLLVRLDLVSGRSNRAALRTIESTMALDMHTYHLDGLGDGAAVDDWHSRVCVLHGSVIFCIAAPQTEDAIALARIAVRRLPAG